MGYGNHAIRSENWRYIQYEDGTEELYDKRSDPLEWSNLASKEQYVDIKQELKKWLPGVNNRIRMKEIGKRGQRKKSSDRIILIRMNYFMTLSYRVMFVYLFLSFGVISCGKKPGKNSSRPNILFIMSDDHAYQAISAYDDRLIQTPNIDRLAKQGALFSNSCVTNSICAPSRATILTGKHNHINGKIDNRSPFDTTQITFPQLFQNAGYQTAMYGKLHFGNNPKGVDDFMILPGQGHYVNPDFITNDGDTTITGHVTDIITDLTLEWFREKRDKDKPFLMMYLHKAPHRPWWPNPKKFKEFAKKEFPLPETLFDNYKNRGTAAKTAEMNILKDLRYGHDSKIRPETMEEMVNLEPYVQPYNWGGNDGFTTSYVRFNSEQKTLYDPVIDSINIWFRNNWEGLTNKEKNEMEIPKIYAGLSWVHFISR